MRIWAASLLVVGATIAVADDGNVSMSGNPELLHGHSSVRMVSEHVWVNVHRDHVSVVCNFVFQNTGRACSVRMGFPDQGDHPNNYDPDEDEGKPEPKSFEYLDDFRSWINGKRMRTTRVAGKDGGDSWLVKTVRFRAGQTLFVKDMYDHDVGIGATMSKRRHQDDTYYISEVPYIVSSGSSWKGPIGFAEVDVRLPFRIKRAKRILNESETPISPLESYTHWGDFSSGFVGYTGFCRAKVSGHSLIFRKARLKPSEADDICVAWANK